MIMRAIGLVLAIAAGVAASQVPEFAQQYRQRLGGAVDELARIIETFDRDAAAAGTDRTGGIALMARNDKSLVRSQAVAMAETIIRHARLSEQQAAFESSAPLVRLKKFFEDFDPPLVESTLRTFEPAVPATAEGAVFAVTGFLGVALILRMLGFIFRPRRRRHLVGV